MTSIRIVQQMKATPEQVWQHLGDVASHVEWMRDAESIRFTSENHQGVGTTFDCVTRIGPLRVTDKIEITAWEPNKEMSVTHSGMVTGSGSFYLDTRNGNVDVIWEERLDFPIWFASKLGEAVARPILEKVWSGNLLRLKDRVEGAR